LNKKSLASVIWRRRKIVENSCSTCSFRRRKNLVIITLPKPRSWVPVPSQMCTHNQQLNSLYIFALLSSHHIKKGPNYTMEIRKSYACNYIYYFYILYYCATTTTTIMISLYLRSMIQFLYYSLIEKKILLFLLQFFFKWGKVNR